MKHLIAALIPFVSLPATADVIDFSPLAFSGGASTPDQKYDTVTVSGYRFTALQPAFMPLIVHAQSNPDNADFGGATLGIGTTGDALGFEFSRVDGSVFDFTGAQLTQLYDEMESPGNGGTFFIYADDIFKYGSSYNVTPGFQDYAFSILGASSIRITSINVFQIDNLLVSGGVPEPSTWAMMLAGFGMIGVISRYRRRTGKVSYA